MAAVLHVEEVTDRQNCDPETLGLSYSHAPTRAFSTVTTQREQFPSRPRQRTQSGMGVHEDDDDYSDDVHTPLHADSTNGQQHYDKDEESDSEYVAGDDTEDSRAILLQEINGEDRERTTLKSVKYDPSDDSPEAMVHRVRFSHNCHRPSVVIIL